MEAPAGGLLRHTADVGRRVATFTTPASAPPDPGWIPSRHGLHQFHLLCLSCHPGNLRRRGARTCRPVRRRTDHLDLDTAVWFGALAWNRFDPCRISHAALHCRSSPLGVDRHPGVETVRTASAHLVAGIAHTDSHDDDAAGEPR